MGREVGCNATARATGSSRLAASEVFGLEVRLGLGATTPLLLLTTVLTRGSGVGEGVVEGCGTPLRVRLKE